jgi:hypothetical protein
MRDTMLQKLIQVLKQNMLITHSIRRLKYYYLKYFVSDLSLINKNFKKELGRDLNLEEPIKYNDKIQWLKLNWYDATAIICVDKYEVRKFVEEKIGSKVLNELYGIFNSVEEIELNLLPKAFVVKATHDSGSHFVCKDKNSTNWRAEFKKMKSWLKTNYYWESREWVYKDIRPRLICEKYLTEDNGDELLDYRLFCFGGEPKFIALDLQILKKGSTRRNLYDLEWNRLNAEISYPNEFDVEFPKPAQLEQMIEYSKVLAKGFPHVRIDFYNVSNKIYFGEMTFFHRNGFGPIKPEAFEIKMGSWLKIPA